MKKEDIKSEIISYVQALETNYNSSINEYKERCERLRVQLRKEKAKHVNDVIEKGDLENLFVDCVEDVRRNVIKRRLKAEIIGKKKIGKFDENSKEAKEFEDSLMKLANLAKDRVKFTEFTSQDRNNLLDLFVNNEKTLIKIYEILFPRKTQSTNMKTNSLRQLNALKNSSDTIQLGGPHPNKSDFLKGDSIMQRSVDQTMADSDPLHQSSILPSILPAINSVHSNEIINSYGGKHFQGISNQSPHDLAQNSVYKGHQFSKDLMINVNNLNQRSAMQMNKQSGYV
jgi:hypothetical protein